LQEEIGKGGFSHIFKASYKAQPCALKRLMPSLTLIHDFEHEVMIMTSLQHEKYAVFFFCFALYCCCFLL
jgi:serine/threonine protein kinase